MMILVVRINHTKDRVGLYKAEIVYGMNKISHFSIPIVHVLLLLINFSQKCRRI